MKLSANVKLCVAVGLALGSLAAAPRRSSAKERHLEQVRVLLMARAARCNTCHVAGDGGWKARDGLNAYGRALSELPAGDALADRMVELEREGVQGAQKSNSIATDRRDVDGDGVPNWIEVLAGKSPADAADVPSEKKRARIERVVSCTICHDQTNLPGKSGIEANPHNPLGKLLASTYILDRGEKKPAAPSAIQAAAERTPILARLELVRKKKPPKGRATYWQRIRMLRSSVDPAEEPSSRQLAAFKKQAAAQRSRRKRDPELGLIGDTHKPEGFLADGMKLD